MTYSVPGLTHHKAPATPDHPISEHANLWTLEQVRDASSKATEAAQRKAVILTRAQTHVGRSRKYKIKGPVCPAVFWVKYQ